MSFILLVANAASFCAALVPCPLTSTMIRTAADHQQPLTLTERMRSATTADHDKSNKLVNLKLGLVLTSPSLYGEAVALFAPVFAKIENIIEQHKDHPQIGKIYPILDLIRRTPGCEADMEYFLTTDRRIELEVLQKDKSISALDEYLRYLDKISKEDPILMLAFVYHQYAGVLAGGQLIKAMVRKAMGLSKDTNEGVEIFCMKDDVAAKDVMARLRRILNEDIDLSEGECKRLADEGATVFQLNDQLIRSISGTNAWVEASNACLKRILLPLVGIGIFIAAYSAWLVFVKYEFVHANEFDHEGP